DQMIKSVKSNFENVVLRIVGDAQQRQPFRFDLIAEGERGDLDLGTLADEALRHPIEEAAPFRLFKLSYSHRSSPTLGRAAVDPGLAAHFAAASELKAPVAW